MTEVFTTADGLRLAYDDRGSGTPLLCLAGLTRNMGDFDTLLGPLEGRCRLIRLDARGRGQSDPAPDFNDYNVPREAQDVLELLDYLGLSQVAILGTSRGGLVAMMLAAMAKPRLSGVILNDVGPVVSAEGLTRILGYVGKRPAHATLDAMAAATETALGAEFPGVPLNVWREKVALWYDEVPGEARLKLRYDPRLGEALAAQAKAAGSAFPDLWPLFDALAGLPLATIRGGNSDLLSPETLAEMQRRRPDMAVAVIPDRGHVPFLDEPAALALIRDFLARLETTR